MNLYFSSLTIDSDSSSMKSWSPPDGQLWYADDILVATDGNGSGSSNYVILAGIWPESVTPDNANEIADSPYGFAATSMANDSTDIEGGKLDAYLTSDHELLIWDQGHEGAIAHIVVNLRRVM